MACVVLLFVIAEVTDGRGQIDWNFGPTDRRSRQISLNGNGPLAGLFGMFARPDDNKQTRPLVGLLGGLLSEFGEQIQPFIGGLAQQNNNGNNNQQQGGQGSQGGITFPGRPIDLLIKVSGWFSLFFGRLFPFSETNMLRLLS